MRLGLFSLEARGYNCIFYHPKWVPEQMEVQQKDEQQQDRCATREIPFGYMEPIPAMSTVQPCD